MSRRVAVDVGALYEKGLGRLGDVGRLLDEMRQLRASRGNGKGLSAAAPEPDDDPGPDDEDTEDEDEVTARCLPVGD